MCRVELFLKSDIIDHSEQNPKSFSNKRKKDKKSFETCSSHFIRKMDWIGECDSNNGIISCSICSVKLGEFNWAGRQCSCGKFVVPAFQIHKSCVDPQIFNDTYISKPKNFQ